MKPTHQPRESLREDRIYVLSGYVGEMGGGAKAPLLLCEALIQLGKTVTLFVASPVAATARRLQMQGVHVVVPFCNKGWRWFMPQRALVWQLFCRAQLEKPLLIFVIGLSVDARYLLRLPRLTRVLVWETTEALANVKFVDTRISPCLAHAAAVLAPSHTIARNIRKTYGYDGPIRLLPFWVEDPGTVTPCSTRTQNLLYVGRLDLDKGLGYLIDAFRLLKRRCPAATLTICGGGEIALVRRLAKDTPLINVTGYVSGDELEHAMRGCDAVVLPSLHEGYPLSLLEACARHKPVIATEVGSIPEVFGGKVCALLVPPRDPSALAEAMLTVLSESNEIYTRRCAIARNVFDEVSSFDVVRRRLRDICDNGEKLCDVAV